MLVLTRKSRESVVVDGLSGLGRLIKITVLDINRQRVVLGFEAGPEVTVLRLELWKRLHGIVDPTALTNGRGEERLRSGRGGGVGGAPLLPRGDAATMPDQAWLGARGRRGPSSPTR